MKAAAVGSKSARGSYVSPYRVKRTVRKKKKNTLPGSSNDEVETVHSCVGDEEVDAVHCPVDDEGEDAVHCTSEPILSRPIGWSATNDSMLPDI
jgi:hypothetical protein